MHGIAATAANVPRTRSVCGAGMLAGLAGGVMEVAWISFFQHLTGKEAAVVARGVTRSFVPDYATSGAVPLGIAIHMALAVGLGIAVAFVVSRLLPRIAGTVFEPLAVVLMLVGVWAVNFFVVLPAINPDFVTLVPYGASLASKVLFGVAAALVFRMARWRSADNPRLWEAIHVKGSHLDDAPDFRGAGIDCCGMGVRRGAQCQREECRLVSAPPAC